MEIHTESEMKIYELPVGSLKKSRKKIFLESYRPDMNIDIKKTADSFGVSIQMVYRWIKSYKESSK